MTESGWIHGARQGPAQWACRLTAVGLLFLLVCTSTSPMVLEPVHAQNASRRREPVSLRVGDSVTIDAESSLTFTAVRRDSRCPKTARCVRAGEAVIALSLSTTRRAPTELTVAVPPGGTAAVAVSTYTIDVRALGPEATEGVELEQRAYVLTLQVTRR